MGVLSLTLPTPAGLGRRGFLCLCRRSPGPGRLPSEARKWREAAPHSAADQTEHPPAAPFSGAVQAADWSLEILTVG